jgi:hypothetical protein
MSIQVRSRWHVLLAIVIVALLALAATQSALFVPFDPQSAGQRPLMVLRGLLLAALFVASRERPNAGWTMAIAMALFVLSLVVPGAILLFVLISAGLLVALPAVPLLLPRPGARDLLIAAAAGALAVTAALAIRPPTLPPLPALSATPAESTKRWLSADNPYRARTAALAWVKSEGNDPGEAYFALARIDQQLGFDVRARKVLEKVRDRSSSEVNRRHASELLDELTTPLATPPATQGAQ